MKRYFRWNQEDVMWSYNTETTEWKILNVNDGKVVDKERVGRFKIPYNTVNINNLHKHPNYVEYTEEEIFLKYL